MHKSSTLVWSIPPNYAHVKVLLGGGGVKEARTVLKGE